MWSLKKKQYQLPSIDICTINIESNQYLLGAQYSIKINDEDEMLLGETTEEKHNIMCFSEQKNDGVYKINLKQMLAPNGHLLISTNIIVDADLKNNTITNNASNICITTIKNGRIEIIIKNEDSTPDLPTANK